MSKAKTVILLISGAFLYQALSALVSNDIPKAEKIEIPKEWINISPETLQQDNQDLLDVVRHYFLEPPPDKSIPYNFSNYNRKLPVCNTGYSQAELTSVDFNPSCGQVQLLEGILRQFTPGFFLDCGANDGIFISNTIWLERKLAWSGLLVEADPNAYKMLASIKRKAWLSNTCFSITPFPKEMEFFINPKYSEASGLIRSDYYGATKSVKVQCLPLYTTLLALNRTVIDFFTLDVEGNEMEILKTIPFDKIVFKVLSIEHLFIRGGKRVLRDFMESKGYIFYRTIVRESSGDSIFLHPSVELNSKQLEQLGYEDKEKTAELRKWGPYRAQYTIG